MKKLCLVLTGLITNIMPTAVIKKTRGFWLLISLLFMLPLPTLAVVEGYAWPLSLQTEVEYVSHYVDLSKRQMDRLTGGICSTDTVMDCDGYTDIVDGVKLKAWSINYQPKPFTVNNCIQIKSHYMLTDEDYQEFSVLLLGEILASGQCGPMLGYSGGRSQNGIFISAQIAEFLLNKTREINNLIQHNQAVSSCKLANSKRVKAMSISNIGIETGIDGRYLYEIVIMIRNDDVGNVLYFDPHTGTEVCNEHKYEYLNTLTK